MRIDVVILGARAVASTVALGCTLAGSVAFAQTQPVPGQQNRGVIELMNQIEALNAELNRVRGDLEVINNGLENAQRRQRDMYLDLDTRLRRLEGSPDASGKSDKAGELDARVKRLEEYAASHGARGDGADLDARVKRLEAAAGLSIPAPSATAAGGPPPSAASTSSGPVVVTPAVPVPPVAPTVQKPAAPAGQASAASEAGGARRAYDNALASYRAGDYQGAINAFEGLVKRYPRDALAPNAQYWIGDAWFNLRDFRAAAAAQQALIANYPDSPKIPDAMLNLSSAQLALGENPAARRTLEDLVARFPQSEAADKARQRLAKFK